jgi:SAM-dependent methyltransferase
MKQVEKCRACGSAEFEQVMDFGFMPLANNLGYSKHQAIEAERFPLILLACKECTLLQLSVVIPPEKLFKDYVYRSSMSQTYKDHCLKMAKALKDRFGNFENPGRLYILDIAGNDGTLLLQFKEVFDAAVMNVDPAGNLCRLSLDAHIPAYTGFWGTETAKKVFGEEGTKYNVFRHADIITATNVFAHVDDVKDFLAGIKSALAPNGVAVIEFPYVMDYLRKAEFDTTYHEHLSYFGLTSFSAALKGSGLRVFDSEKFDIHGGTLRAYVCHENVYAAAHLNLYSADVTECEANSGYLAFRENSAARIDAFKKCLQAAAVKNQTVAAFGASAKGNTFLNMLGDAAKGIAYIVDETPEKIGKFSPGVGLEIVGPEILFTSPPDILILLAWNFRTEIENKLRAQGYAGEIVCF